MQTLKSFEDFIGTSFGSIDADLLLIWMNNFQLRFRFHHASCLGLPTVPIISRGECRFVVLMSSIEIGDNLCLGMIIVLFM